MSRVIFHVIPRAHCGPRLLAMIAFEKFGQHQPLNRQSERYAREGVDRSVSTLADHIGSITSVLRPLYNHLEAHVMAAERLHGDDTTVPVLAKGKTVTGRLWTYVRDDRTFCGPAPPAAIYYYSPDRCKEHPLNHLEHYNGILQADAYAGYKDLFDEQRVQGRVTSAFCWAHARREFFELADSEAAARRGLRRKCDAIVSPVALEALRRIDEIFAIERELTGRTAMERLAARRERLMPLVTSLECWMRETYSSMSRHADPAKAVNYMLCRWDGFARFLSDGRICLSNNAAERALRGIAVGRRNWMFCGSDRGGQSAAMMYSFITTARMNDIDPQAWLAEVLASIADHPVHRLDELLPWQWKQRGLATLAA